MTSPDGTRRVKQPHRELLLNRLRRAEGQLRGISGMIAEDRYCVDVLVQISAVKAALDAVALQILEDHSKGCVRRAIQSGDGDPEIAELVSVVKRLIG